MTEGYSVVLELEREAFPVAVPAGDHEVEMRYRPASLRRGLWLAALGLLACGAALFARRPGVSQSRGAD